MYTLHLCLHFQYIGIYLTHSNEINGTNANPRHYNIYKENLKRFEALLITST